MGRGVSAWQCLRRHSAKIKGRRLEDAWEKVCEVLDAAVVEAETWNEGCFGGVGQSEVNDCIWGCQSHASIWQNQI